MNGLMVHDHLQKLRGPLVALLLLVALPLMADDEDEEYVQHELALSSSLVHLGEQAQAGGVPVLIMFSTLSCEYCERLENEVLGPMKIANGNSTQVIMGKVQVGSGEALLDFNGQQTSPEQIADKYNIDIFPTVALLSSQGKILLPKIIGYQTPEFYAAYLDAAIVASQTLVTSQENM